MQLYPKALLTFNYIINRTEREDELRITTDNSIKELVPKVHFVEADFGITELF